MACSIPSTTTTMTEFLWKIILVCAISLSTSSTSRAQHLSEVRLVNGTSRYSGIVQVLDGARSAWLSVCHTTSWDISDAQVICNQLGHNGANRAFVVEVEIANEHLNAARFYNQQFACRGTEAQVNACPRLPIEIGNMESCIPARATCYDERYIGCFGDEPYDRVLTAATYPMAFAMTPELCINHCKVLGHAYAGVEYGTECYCGRAGENYARKGRYKDNQCQMPCPGSPNLSCGGVGTMAVYRTIRPTPPPPTTVITLPPTTVAAPPPAATTFSPIVTIATRKDRTPKGKVKVVEDAPTTVLSRTAPPVAANTRAPDVSHYATTPIQLNGARVSPTTVTTLATIGALLFLVCSSVLLIVATIHRRRRRKIVTDISPYALSSSVERVMDTTYLDPMNSVSDSAVYSSLSVASESDFDSTFGGGGVNSAYLGLSFKDLEQRQQVDYASLNAEPQQHEKEGSYATTQSLVTTSESAVYSDGGFIDGSSTSAGSSEDENSSLNGKRCEGVVKKELGVYDAPMEARKKSAIYASGNGIHPYEYGFGFDHITVNANANAYSSVHYGNSYCEVGEPIVAAVRCEQQQAAFIPRATPTARINATSRDYASVYIHNADDGKKTSTDSVSYQNGNHGYQRLTGSEYAMVSELEAKRRISEACSGSADPNKTQTLPAWVRLGSEQVQDPKRFTSRDGGYDSVYFEGGKQSNSLPHSSRRSRAQLRSDAAGRSLPSDTSSVYATIQDERGFSTNYDINNHNDDDDAFDNGGADNDEYHSYSYVDHKKLLGRKSKKGSLLSPDVGAGNNPRYENLSGLEQMTTKMSPKLSVSSIISQLSSRSTASRYSTLEEGKVTEQFDHPLEADVDIAEHQATETRDARSVRLSDAEYAVVNKTFCNSEAPAVTHQILPNFDGEDYDILHHPTS